MKKNILLLWEWKKSIYNKGFDLWAGGYGKNVQSSDEDN